MVGLILTGVVLVAYIVASWTEIKEVIRTLKGKK